MGTDTDQQGTQKRRCRNRSSEGQCSQTGWQKRWKRWRKSRCLSPGRCTQVDEVEEGWQRMSIGRSGCCSVLDSSAQF